MAESHVTIVGFSVEERPTSDSPSTVSKPVVRQRSLLSELLAQGLASAPTTPRQQSYSENNGTDDGWCTDYSDDERDIHIDDDGESVLSDDDINVTRPIDIPIPKDKTKKAAFFRNIKLKVELRRNEYFRQRGYCRT